MKSSAGAIRLKGIGIIGVSNALENTEENIIYYTRKMKILNLKIIEGELCNENKG